MTKLSPIPLPPSPYHIATITQMRFQVDYYTDADDFCEEHPDVVILATSILSLENVSGAPGAESPGAGCWALWGAWALERGGGELEACRPFVVWAAQCGREIPGEPQACWARRVALADAVRQQGMLAAST